MGNLEIFRAIEIDLMSLTQTIAAKKIQHIWRQRTSQQINRLKRESYKIDKAFLASEGTQSFFRVFSENSALYAKNKPVQKRTAIQYIDSMAIPPNSVVMDIGCGDGEITAYLASQNNVACVTGIDRDVKMINLAKQQEKGEHISASMAFEVLDAINITHKNSFNLLACFWVLHWIREENIRQVLENFNHALKVGGELHLIVRLPGSAVSQVIFELTQTPKWKHFYQNCRSDYNSMTYDNYCKALEEGGFGNFDIHQECTQRTYFDSDQKFKDYLLPITDKVSYIVNDDPKTQQDLINEFLNEIVTNLRCKLGLNCEDSIYTEVPILIGKIEKKMEESGVFSKN